VPVVINVNENHPYFELAQVFEAAFNQAAVGKGKERHAYSEEEAYQYQVLCEIDRRLRGNADGPLYQAVKKIYESARMDPQRAIHELLGAINYTAAAVILLKEKLDQKETPEEPIRIEKQKLYDRFMEIQNKTVKTAAEKKEKTDCASCPLSQIDTTKKEEETSTELDDLFDDNFGVDQTKSSKLELGE